MGGIVMDFGETRHIRLKVINTKGQDFKITKCDYELQSPDGEIEAGGQTDILEHILDVVITPKMRGEYQLKYIYYIADEILIERVGLTVM